MKIEWQTGAGNKIEISVEAVYGLDLNARRKDYGRKEVAVTATVDGVPHYGHLQTIDHPQVVAKIGKVGITAENYSRITQAIAAVEQTIAAHNAACDAHEAALDALTAQGAEISRRMAG